MKKKKKAVPGGLEELLRETDGSLCAVSLSQVGRTLYVEASSSKAFQEFIDLLASSRVLITWRDRGQWDRQEY